MHAYHMCVHKVSYTVIARIIVMQINEIVKCTNTLILKKTGCFIIALHLSNDPLKATRVQKAFCTPKK